MKLLIFAAVALSIAAIVGACGGLALTAANTPALFGEFERRADIPYGTRPRQRLDVYTPWYAKDRPIIVFWYGGGFDHGKKSQYRFVGAALAKAGYVAVLPDYRLYPEVKFPAFVEDGAEALAWVVSHAAQIGGDPKRIYVSGHSAGAHLAAMLAYDRARLARVALPPDTVRGLIGLAGPYALTPNDATLHAIFDAPYTPADWRPAELVIAGAPPALLIHGDADDVVDVNHARTLAAALEAVGTQVTLRTYSNRGHRDPVAAFAVPARRKLPVIEEIHRFVGEGAKAGSGA
jgi:acetyl esterase/lipase